LAQAAVAQRGFRSVSHLHRLHSGAWFSTSSHLVLFIPLAVGMAAAWKAALTTFLVMWFMPSTHALVFQHDKSEACSDTGLISGIESTCEGCTLWGLGSWSCYDRGNGNVHGTCHTEENVGGMAGMTFHLHGNCHGGTQGGIRQTFATTAGVEYKLTFLAIAGAWDGVDTDYFEISTNGGSSWTQYAAPPNHLGHSWLNMEHTFTASAPSTDLIFWADGNECIDVDNIILETCTVAAVGDPHLRNMYGERFDLLREGKSVLISIPRGKVGKDALLAVEADARSLGGQCADTYFQALNITGAWADTVKPGGLRYVASSASPEEPKWAKFGPVELKVVHGRTAQGAQYLNIYVKNLGRVGYDVGGLLGLDDHSEAATPTQACLKRLALLEDGPKGLGGSVAEAAA